MSIPKRHHYLPRFYLEGFTNDGYFWVSDRSQGRIRRTKPKTTAVRKHYYSFEDEEGNRDVSVEKALAGIEGAAKTVFDKLERDEEVSVEDRFHFSLFLGILYCRIPSFERHANECVTGFSEVVLRRNLEDPKTAAGFDSPPEEFLEYLDSGQFSLRLSSSMRILQTLDQGAELGRHFFTSNWMVARAHPKTSFVTCDTPLGILLPPKMPRFLKSRPWGVASSEVITVFPLSCGTCLLMRGQGGTLCGKDVPRNAVREINMAIVAETEVYAIARDEKLLKSLARAGSLFDPDPPKRTKVEDRPHPSGDAMKSILVTSLERNE